MIRPATQSDIPGIARLGKQFHAKAGWSEVSYSEADCAASLEMFMSSGVFIGFVADEGSISGMIGGVVSPVYFNQSHMSGEELFWYVSPDAPQLTGIRLLDAMENAARERGCKTWQMKSLARLGGERMTALYERRGYRASEHLFIKEL